MPSEMKRLRQLEEENAGRADRGGPVAQQARCCKTSSSEISRGCPQALDGRSRLRVLAGERPLCLPRSASQAFDLSLPLPTDRARRPPSNGSRQSDPLRLSLDPFAAQVGGLGCQSEPDLKFYQELSLPLQNKARKRRVKAKLRDKRRPATRAKEMGHGLVHDLLATGRKLRILTNIDTFSRFSPGLDVRFNFRGADVVEAMEQFGAAHGSRLVSGSTKVPSSSVATATVVLSARRPPGLLPHGQADRQCLQRVVQREVPQRMPQRPLFHKPVRSETGPRYRSSIGHQRCTRGPFYPLETASRPVQPRGAGSKGRKLTDRQSDTGTWRLSDGLYSTLNGVLGSQLKRRSRLMSCLPRGHNDDRRFKLTGHDLCLARSFVKQDGGRFHLSILTPSPWPSAAINTTSFASRASLIASRLL